MIKVVVQASVFFNVHILLEVDVNEPGFKHQICNQTYLALKIRLWEKIYNLKIISSMYTHDEIEKG